LEQVLQLRDLVLEHSGSRRCFTTYGQALNNGGPLAISIAWPLISLIILTVDLGMAACASAFPTAGGIYYWASKLGRRRLGLVHRAAGDRRGDARGDPLVPTLGTQDLQGTDPNSRHA
jgi:hypothetical protein